MKWFRMLSLGLMAAAAISLSACGGGGGGGGGAGGEVVDPTPVTNTVFDAVPLAGLPNGTFSAGISINDDGLAVGFSDDGTAIKAARWTVTDAAPAATALASLEDSGNYGAAYGVNLAGIIVGESQVDDGNTVATFWGAGSNAASALDRTGLFPTGPSAAYAINTGNEIVGEAAYDATGKTQAVYWLNTSAPPVGLPHLVANGISSAYFISDAGLVLGESLNDQSRMQAVVWRPDGAGGFEAPTVLTTVANQVASVAFGVNEAGQIVGEAELTGGAVQGVIWTLNADFTEVASVQSLGADTSAGAINDDKRIVGYTAAATGNDRARVWNAEKPQEDSQQLANVFSQAYGINNESQIVGLSGNQAFAALPRQE